MRYGLRFAEGDPFPRDTELGIELEDEPIIVEQDCPECPDCPPVVECEVECRGWDVVQFRSPGLGTTTHTFQVTSTSFQVWYQGGSIILIPQGEWCGHKRRFLITANNLEAGYQQVIVSNSTEGETAFALTMSPTALGFASRCMTIQYQIDLTDAEPGSETWTDICNPMTFCGQAPG